MGWNDQRFLYLYHTAFGMVGNIAEESFRLLSEIHKAKGIS